MTTEPRKSDLYAMLRQAVVNTGGVPVGEPDGPRVCDAPPPAPAAPARPVALDMPTADQVARAIIAAARETGEDPIACASRVEGVRCRHYAMHALGHAFPGAGRHVLARVVGCPGKPEKFWHNSVAQVLNRFGPGKRASWWSEAAYQSVIEAIR